MPVPPKIRNRRGRDTALTGFAWVSLNALAVVWAAWALAGWSLDLTNLSARATLLLLSITLRATSQVVWFYKRGLKPYILGTKRAAGICAFNMLLDGVPLFFVLMDGTARSRVTSGDVVCLLLVLGGLAVERGSEIQRAAWKRKQRNKGKCYTRGLFKTAVHVNYTGYFLWRLGMCQLSRRWFTLVCPLLILYMFVGEVRMQYHRNTRKYGARFSSYAARTPNLIPGVW